MHPEAPVSSEPQTNANIDQNSAWAAQKGQNLPNMNKSQK